MAEGRVVPALSEPGASSLPPRARAYLDAKSALQTAAATAVVVAAALLLLDGRTRTYAATAALALGVVSAAVEIPVVNRLTMRWTTYSVADDFLYITRGALLRTSVLVPVHQVLNVETVQGPLLRRYDLTTVKLTCVTDVVALGPLDSPAVEAVRRAVALGGGGRRADD